MALNTPRTINYQFKVFEFDGFVWLFDDSARTYLCSSEPTVFAEPLYMLDSVDGMDDLPDPTYFTADRIVYPISIQKDEDFASDIPENIAWATAREIAHANYLI